MGNIKDGIENRAENSTINREGAVLLREKYKKSGLPYTEFARILGVKENTLAMWLSLKRTPTSYFVKYALEKLKEYEESSTFGNAIRAMSNSEIAELLTDVRDSALVASGNISNIKDEYRDMAAFVNKHHECPLKLDIPLDNIENTAIELKRIYEASGLTYDDLSAYLSVSRPTLNMWLALRRNPPLYFVHWAKKKIKVLNSEWENDGELIKNMSNSELIELLSDIRDNALNASGEDVNEKKKSLEIKYQDMTDFVNSTYLIKPRLNSSFNDSIKAKRLNELNNSNGA